MMILRWSLPMIWLITGCASPGVECVATSDPSEVGVNPSCFDEAVEETPAASTPDEQPPARGEEEPPPGPPSRPEPPEPLPVAPCSLETTGGLPQAPEGPFIGQGHSVSGQREICTSVMHATAGARESVLEVTLTAWHAAEPAHLSVRDLGGHVLAGPALVAPGEGIEVSLMLTGEVFLHLEPVDPDDATNDYSLKVDCVEGCEAEYTRYPVVLLHGLGGAESFGEMNYYFQVREVLEPLGYALHCPAVSPFSTPDARALEWETHLDTLVAEGAGRRFNLIAHSQAGLDARYLVSGLGRADLVVSVVTVGTPHHGTRLGDLLYGLVEDETVDGYWVDVGASAFAQFFGLAADDTSLVDAMGSMTLEAVAEFNAQIPDHEDVYYASWAGRSCGALEFSCQEKCGGEIVDPALAATYFILWLNGAPNDGMVPIESAKWGDYRGEICADHADQVGLFGDTANEAFDHLDFYLEELRRLAVLGL